jgi:tetratricopeptide (TPR) repeat protein
MSTKGEFELLITIHFNLQHQFSSNGKRENIWLKVKLVFRQKEAEATECLFFKGEEKSLLLREMSDCPCSHVMTIYQTQMSHRNSTTDLSRTLEWLCKEMRLTRTTAGQVDDTIQFYYITARTVLFKDDFKMRCERAIEIAQFATSLVTRRNKNLSRRDLFSVLLEAECYFTQGKVLFRNDQRKEAEESYTKAMELFEEAGDPIGYFDVVNSLVNALRALHGEEHVRSTQRVLEDRVNAKDFCSSPPPPSSIISSPCSFNRTPESVKVKVPRRLDTIDEKGAYELAMFSIMID